MRLEALGARSPADLRIRVFLERSRELQARPPTHRDGALRLDKK